MQQSSQAQPVHGGNLAWAAALVGCSPDEILDFSASINPLGPPETVIAAIQSRFSDLPHYPDPNYRQLRQSLAHVHGLSPDWVLPGNGSAELLTWASRELAELEATVVVTPAFRDYLRALQAFTATVEPYPLVLDGFGNASDRPSSLYPADLADFRLGNAEVNPATLSSSCLAQLPAFSQSFKLNDRPGLLLNNPHNPTGLMFSTAAVVPLLEQFALVVIDEAFMDFLPPDQQQSCIEWVQEYPNLVILRSLTKFYSLAGLRLGYAIAHPDRLRRWQQWRDPWSVNVLAEAAGIAGLKDTAFQRQTWAWLQKARSQLLADLSNLPGLAPFPGAANYLLVRSERSTVELQRQLLQTHRVLIRDCVSFPELGDRFFRVAVRTLEENQRLVEGLAQVLKG